MKIIVLKPGPIQDPADPGLEPGRVEEKTGEGKTRYDPATWSKTRLQPVDFFFLLKQRRFDFFLKKNLHGRPGDLVKTRNPGLGSGWV